MPGMPYKIMSIVTRKLEGVKHFHYYLCRQLKGGGMEIKMKKAVIIGAGQNGRGFIAPLVENNGYTITFLDKDPELIRQLQEQKEYIIRYFGGRREPRIIRGFDAYIVEEPRALQSIVEADVVFISVFASHVGELAELLKKAASEHTGNKLTIFCCENGVNVKQPLIDAEVDAVISEGVIFCTTLRPDKTKLDIFSQDYPELPVDGQVEGLSVRLEGMPWESDFPGLIQRKIYTYNFMSAVVAYLGSYKKYEVYGEAANDPEIAACMTALLPSVSRIIARRYQISYEKQLKFTQAAIDKFQNRDIYDTVYRNARQVKRKLGREERIQTPLRLACEYGEDTAGIELVAAAALYYGEQYEELDVSEVLKEIAEQSGQEKEGQRILEKLETLRAGKKISEIMGNAQSLYKF